MDILSALHSPLLILDQQTINYTDTHTHTHTHDTRFQFVFHTFHIPFTFLSQFECSSVFYFLIRFLEVIIIC
jgi:hypothetical protein